MRLASLDEDNIDWLRVAEPQDDLYDSAVVIAQMTNKPPDEVLVPGATLLPFRMNNYWTDLKYIPAASDHPNAIVADRILRSWPAVYNQCKILLSEVLVSVDSSASPASYGSSSGPGPNGFGSICVTLYDPVGAAEGIVHELAHHKLKALGVGMECASSLILNDCKELYLSPIRYDKRRPMSAILHAQYSYTYVLTLAAKIFESSADEEIRRRIARHSIAKYLPKIRFGYLVIANNVRATVEGRQFLSGMYHWINKMIEESSVILSSLGIPEQTFAHPIQTRSARS